MTEKLSPILRRCFKPIKGHKPELRKISPDQKTTRMHLNKAHNNLKAMKLMYDQEFFDWTIICGYYAMYHGVLASLSYIGIRAYSHLCAIAAFQNFFIDKDRSQKEYIHFIRKAEQLGKKYTDSLQEARENRVRVQYGVQIICNEDAEWIIEDAEDFVLLIEEFIEENK
jgi:uncharacterized protein (UPF0332 family)